MAPSMHKYLEQQMVGNELFPLSTRPMLMMLYLYFSKEMALHQ
jgi:hypothetical protein